jgi:hypothetical protein
MEVLRCAVLRRCSVTLGGVREGDVGSRVGCVAVRTRKRNTCSHGRDTRHSLDTRAAPVPGDCRDAGFTGHVLRRHKNWNLSGSAHPMPQTL